MTVQQSVLEELKIIKGQPAMTPGQLQRRIWAFMDREWPQAYRERDYLAYEAWKEGMKDTLAEAEANFIFNYKLDMYRRATDRLSRYLLSEGQSLLTDQRGTGIIDPDTGEEIMEEIVIRSEIEPLPDEIEQTTYDEDGNPITELVPNPAIVADLQERADAQSVIDAIPKEVKDFDAT